MATFDAGEHACRYPSQLNMTYKCFDGVYSEVLANVGRQLGVL